jgi:hypothetical protein
MDFITVVNRKLKLDEVDGGLKKFTQRTKKMRFDGTTKGSAMMMMMVRETFYNPGMNELKYQATRSPRTVRQIKIIIFFCKFSNIFDDEMGKKC